MLETIIKQPGELLLHRVAFATQAPIAAAGTIDVTARGLVPGALDLIASATINAGVLMLQLAAGGDGERYLVTVRATDSAGELVESEIEVAVVDATWALPDGGAPYLSILNFVQAFGLDEVVRMTDASGTGRIDRDLLVNALVFAQGLVDLHLAGRYALPLAVVPPPIEAIVADLARNRLYPRGAPDGVATAATAAMKLLDRIQSGVLGLPIPLAERGAAPDTDAPVVAVPGRRAYPDGLAGY